MNVWLTPAAIDWILVGVGVEAIALAWFLPRVGGAAWVAPTLLQLAAGAALLWAVRAALAGAPAEWIAAALLASLVAHVTAVLRSFAAAKRSHAGAARASLAEPQTTT
jgi:hypothetical protein